VSGAVALLGLAAVAAAAAWALPRPGRPRAGRGEPPRERRRRGEAELDPAVLLDLLEAALASGASVPGALHALGVAVDPDPAGRSLRRAGTALHLGADWREAWDRTPAALTQLAATLGPAWTDGVDPCPLVRQAGATIRARRRRDAREAAARLGARLVLPLGLCFLPAFVLLAMVPVLLSGVGTLLQP